MDATVTHRVVCPNFTFEAPSLNAAQGYQTGVETAGNCREQHTIEVLVDGDWLPLHIARAREILSARMVATIITADGPLIKCAAGWTAESGARADAAADPVAQPAEWLAALGPHDHVTLTQDGRTVHTDGWCGCATASESEGDNWVRYERWTPEGRLAHGYVCPDCRHITQTG